MLDGKHELSEIEESARERVSGGVPHRDVAVAYVRRVVARCG